MCWLPGDSKRARSPDQLRRRFCPQNTCAQQPRWCRQAGRKLEAVRRARRGPPAMCNELKLADDCDAQCRTPRHSTRPPAAGAAAVGDFRISKLRKRCSTFHPSPVHHQHFELAPTISPSKPREKSAPRLARSLRSSPCCPSSSEHVWRQVGAPPSPCVAGWDHATCRRAAAAATFGSRPAKPLQLPPPVLAQPRPRRAAACPPAAAPGRGASRAGAPQACRCARRSSRAAAALATASNAWPSRCRAACRSSASSPASPPPRAAWATTSRWVLRGG